MPDSINTPGEPDGAYPRVTTPTGARTDSPLQRALPIYYALLLAILTVLAVYLLLQLRHVLLLLFISLLFAATVSRPAAYLERLRIPRAAAALLVYLAAIGVLAGIGWLVLPPLFNQVARLGNDLPAYAERYNQLRERYETLREQYPGLQPFDAQAAEIGDRLTSYAGRRLTRLPFTIIGIFLDLLAVFAISMLLITGRGRLLAFGLPLVRPEHRPQIGRVIERMWLRLGHELRAKLIVVASIATITYGPRRLSGVPYPVRLAGLV